MLSRGGATAWSGVARSRAWRGWWLVWWRWRDGQCALPHCSVVTRTSQLPAPARATATGLASVSTGGGGSVWWRHQPLPPPPHQPRLVLGSSTEMRASTCQEQPLGQVLIWLIQIKLIASCCIYGIFNCSSDHDQRKAINSRMVEESSYLEYIYIYANDNVTPFHHDQTSLVEF